MRNFAFIFARGGSKGLYRKNVKKLAGKPLIQYSIETAQAAPSIDMVFVSTDDNEIAQISSRAGAVVINRPDELATDTSSEWFSWRHAIEHVNQIYGDFDGFISLPATSPLRSVEDVELAIKQRVNAKADICISITPSNRSPFFNMVKINENDHIELVNPPMSAVVRRQDAPEVFDITTVVYATVPNYILEFDGVLSGKVTSIIVPKERAVDIDDIYDFKLAQAIIEIEE